MRESDVVSFARQSLLAAVPLAAGLVVAYGLTSPDPKLFLILLGGPIVLFGALAMPPHAFVAGSLLVFGVSSATSSQSISLGSVTIYVTDLLLIILLARALLPRTRAASNNPLRGIPAFLLVIWVGVLFVASIRGLAQGIALDAVIRRETAVIYFPLLYFGYSRVLREHGMVPRLLWRNLALAVLGLASWMLLMRLLNHPFETATTDKLGTLATSHGETVRRDFGFASAFILYPILGLVGFAGLAFQAQPRRRWLFVTLAGIVATMLTLVRGEIFSLSLGALIVLLLRPRVGTHTARFRTAIQVGLAVTAAAAAVLVISPALGHALVERSLPGLQRQSATADSTAEYRLKAFRTGIDTARAHPNGLGVLDDQTLMSRHIPPDYLAHSGSSYLLVDGGWPALILEVLLITALIGRSFRVVANTAWIHPAFVGTAVMLTAYSFGAAGIAGDVWVIGPAALVVALRFVAGATLPEASSDLATSPPSQS